MSDVIPNTRLELLRMARELVINEYIDKRAQDHNAWLAQSDVAWKTKGVKLPYPAFPPYPTEAYIIARANALEQYLNRPAEQKADQKELQIIAAVEESKNTTLQNNAGSLLANTTEVKKDATAESNKLSSIIPSWIAKKDEGKK